MNSHIHELLIQFTLTRFSPGFKYPYGHWLITARSLEIALIAFVPSFINFTQALSAQVIASLMARLMGMYSLEVIHDTLHPFTNFWNNVVMNMNVEY